MSTTKLFTNMRAWFSPSCSNETKKKWEKEGGKIVDDVNEAMFFFSDDPECKKTITVYKNEPSIVVFLSKWIDQAILCSTSGVLSTNKIETYMLVPTKLKKETKVTRTKSQYKDFVDKEREEQDKRWENYNKFVSTKTGKERKPLPQYSVPDENLSENEGELEDTKPLINLMNTAVEDQPTSSNTNNVNHKSNHKNSLSKKTKQIKTKRRSNMNLSESSSDDETNLKNQTQTAAKTSRSKRTRKKVSSESEYSEADNDFVSDITPRRNRAHRSAGTYAKKYVEPETESSSSSSDTDEETERKKRSNKRGRHNEKKGKEQLVNNIADVSKENEPNTKSLTSKDETFKEGASKQTNNHKVSSSRRKLRSDGNKKTNVDETKNVNNNENSGRKEKKNQKEGKKSSIQTKQTRSSAKASREAEEHVENNPSIVESDNEDDVESNIEDEDSIKLTTSNRKRKLYDISTNALQLKEPVICIEKTPVTVRKKSDIDKEKLSPSDIHNMLNEVAGPQVLLSGNVRSSEKKEVFSSINEVASSPQLVSSKEKNPANGLSTKAQVMKDHNQMINHKKIGEKSHSDFAFGSFTGYSHINDFDIPVVRIEDFVVNENGCRVKLRGKST